MMDEPDGLGRKIEGLQHASDVLLKLIGCLRGEEIDITGRGLWAIFCSQIEQATGCHVLTPKQWERYKSLTRRID